MVSPGTTDELLNAVSKQSIPLLPGVSTPSEVMKLMSLGFKEMKFFPAESAGGINMLKSIGGPLPQVTFCPTGGINPVSYTHLRAHETSLHLVCRLLLEKIFF